MKILLSLSFLFLSSSLWAVSDRRGSERPALWRSSFTCATNDLLTISGSSLTQVHFHAIVVASPTVNVDPSRIAVFNSSTTNPVFASSTAAYLATGVNSAASSGSFPDKIEYNVELSSGFTARKQGVACVQYLWDYITPSILREQAFPPITP